MSRLLFGPSVHVLGKTEFDVSALEAWAEDCGLTDVLETTETPLGKIHASLLEGTQSSVDLVPEFAGRFCYASWAKGRGTTDYIENILSSKHGSVLEHSSINFAISGVSRTLTHEWVRHRAGTGISQESQRFVDAKDIKIIVPPAVIPLLEQDADEQKAWEDYADAEAEKYLALQEKLIAKHSVKYSGFKLKKIVNEAARSKLPGCAETKMFWTGNIRALRHIFEVRGSLHADAEVRRLVLKMYYKVRDYLVFSDITCKIDEETGERYLDIVNSKV